MKNKTLLLVMLMVILSITACGHEHTWKDATCTEPKTCIDCGETEGETLAHVWENATCTAPKTCSLCGETEGEALGHKWEDATCTTPKTCSVCGATEGKALGHSVIEWTVDKASSCTEEGKESGICEVCANVVEQSISMLDHTPGDWEIKEKATKSSQGIRVKYCTVCGKELEREIYTLSEEEIEAEYKLACTKYSYDTIARNPDDYIGTYGKYTGKIVQVMEDGNDCQLRVNVTKGKYSYSDTIYVVYTRKQNESRFLEDDIITLYGMNMGTISYESVLGATITIPCVYAEYIDLN